MKVLVYFRAYMVVLGLFLSLDSFILANDTFQVSTPDSKKLPTLYYYAPDLGTLYLWDGKSETLTDATRVKSFPVIKGLKADQIEIYPFKNGSNTDVLLIRHGQWVTLLDPKQDKPLATNIGPLTVTGELKSFTHFITPIKFSEDSSQGVLVFTARAISNPDYLSPTQETRRHILIVDLKGNTYWFPVREDFDLEKLRITMETPGTLTLETNFEEHTTSGLGTGKFHHAILRLDLKTGIGKIAPWTMRVRGSDIVVNPASLLEDKIITEPTQIKLLCSAELSPQAQLAPLRLDGISTSAIAKTASLGGVGDLGVEALLVESAKAQIAIAKKRAAAVRKAMIGIYGQDEAIQKLSLLAAGSLNAEKFTVALLAGLTGTGKTSSAERLAKSLFPKKKNPVFSFSFDKRSERKFIESELYGSGTGYVGSDSLSGLMLWLLENKDGGVLLFDEVDKAEVEAFRVLQSFLDNGEVKIPPHVLKALLAQYSKIDPSFWPKYLFEATNGGKNPDVEITLKLTPQHIVLLGSNAGTEIYHGNSGSSVDSSRLKSVSEITQANARYSEEVVKNSLRDRGWTDDLLARVQAFILYKAFLPEDHAKKVKDELGKIQDFFKNTYRVSLEISDDVRKFLESELYNPLEGARLVENKISSWIKSAIENTILDEKIKPSDPVQVTLRAGDHVKSPSVLELRKQGEIISEQAIGNPLPARPTELLKRAHEMLLPTLEKRIVGHREILKQIHASIIAQLEEAVQVPPELSQDGKVTKYNVKGISLIIYLDGFSGNGKTEIAKAIGEALFDNSEQLVKVPMNTVNTLSAWHEVCVKPMTRAVRSNPESLVVLLDEMPRAGDSDAGLKIAIQNELLSIFDEGELPPLLGEARVVGGVLKQESKKTKLPPFRVFIATGNLFQYTLHGSAERMNNRKMQAHFRSLERRPEIFKAIYEKFFITALRSRLGEPVLVPPLTDEQLKVLLDRFLHEAFQTVLARGISIGLDSSVQEMLMTEYIPLRGGRWLREMVLKYLKASVITMVATNPRDWNGSKIRIHYEPNTRNIIATVMNKQDVKEPPLVLTTIPRMRMGIHPDVEKKEAWKTHVHESGHAIVRRALYGRGSVEEINTFGGGDGGVTHMNAAVPTQNLYNTTMKGPYSLAISLAGNIAEAMILGETSEGASIDYEHARAVAKIMVLDGSTLGLSPIPYEKNLQTGEIILSEALRQEVEARQDALLKFASRLAIEILKRNQKVLLNVAKALEDSPDSILINEQFEEVVKGQVTSLTQRQVKRILRADKATRPMCEMLLLNNPAKPPTGFRAWFDWLKVKFSF